MEENLKTVIVERWSNGLTLQFVKRVCNRAPNELRLTKNNRFQYICEKIEYQREF